MNLIKKVLVSTSLLALSSFFVAPSFGDSLSCHLRVTGLGQPTDEVLSFPLNSYQPGFVRAYSKDVTSTPSFGAVSAFLHWRISSTIVSGHLIGTLVPLDHTVMQGLGALSNSFNIPIYDEAGNSIFSIESSGTLINVNLFAVCGWSFQSLLALAQGVQPEFLQRRVALNREKDELGTQIRRMTSTMNQFSQSRRYSMVQALEQKRNIHQAQRRLDQVISDLERINRLVTLVTQLAVPGTRLTLPLAQALARDIFAERYLSDIDPNHIFTMGAQGPGVCAGITVMLNDCTRIRDAGIPVDATMTTVDDAGRPDDASSADVSTTPPHQQQDTYFDMDSGVIVDQQP